MVRIYFIYLNEIIKRIILLEKHRHGSIIETNHRKIRFVRKIIHRSYHGRYPSFSLSSNTGAHLCDTCTSSLCSHCRSTFLRPVDLIKESTPNRTGSSSHSIESSDSAFFDQRLLDLNDILHPQASLQEILLYVI